MAARTNPGQPKTLSEERLKSVLELSSDWYWEQDKNLRFTLVSGRTLLEGRIESASLIGKTRWEIPGARFEAGERAALQAKLDSRQPFTDHEYERVGPDGHTRTISVSGVPVLDASGHFAGYRGIAKDITERKRAEEEQRRFRAAMDASGDLMLLIDRASMRYVDVNDAACRALGYSREELLTMGPPDIFSTSREDLARLYERMIAGELTAPTVEGVYRCKDGSQLLIEAHPRAVRSAAGDIVVSIARDITERRRAEQLLKLEHTVARYLADAENLQAGLKAT